MRTQASEGADTLLAVWPARTPGVEFAAAAGHPTVAYAFSTELAPDHRWLDFLWELGETAARGGDIRHRLFGAPGQSGALD